VMVVGQDQGLFRVTAESGPHKGESSVVLPGETTLPVVIVDDATNHKEPGDKKPSSLTTPKESASFVATKEEDAAEEDSEEESKKDDEKERKNLRRERNREHARISRERKRRKVETLTEENDSLQRERMAALDECCRLRDALARSEHENARLQQWINQMHYLAQQQQQQADPVASAEQYHYGQAPVAVIAGGVPPGYVPPATGVPPEQPVDDYRPRP